MMGRAPPTFRWTPISQKLLYQFQPNLMRHAIPVFKSLLYSGKIGEIGIQKRPL